MKSYIYLEPTVVEGVGEIPGYILEDAATKAEFHLWAGGGIYAMVDIPDLEELIAMRTWRSSAALDVLLRIKRKATVELSTSKDQISTKYLTTVPEVV